MASQTFDDRDGHIWFDGEMVPWRDATIHVLTHGLHYGSCVFEGMRVYGGRIFKCSAHTQRLINSGKELQIEVPYTVAELDAACHEVVAADNIVDGYVRPLAWRGSEMMGVPAQNTKIHVAIAAWVWPVYFSEDARLKGIRITLVDWARPAPHTAPVRAKAAGLYMICTLAKHESEAAGYDDALMLDWEGNIAESTGSNIFLVQNGVIHTPTPDCFLDGITRNTVIELAKARGYEVVQRKIRFDELAKTDEVFLTGTAVEVTPVREIDDLSFEVGPVTRQLIADFDALVRDASAAASSAA